jgi:hypothetical protein
MLVKITMRLPKDMKIVEVMMSMEMRKTMGV